MLFNKDKMQKNLRRTKSRKSIEYMDLKDVKRRRQIIGTSRQKFTFFYSWMFHKRSEISITNRKVIGKLKLDQNCFNIPKMMSVGANKKILFEVNKGMVGK